MKKRYIPISKEDKRAILNILESYTQNIEDRIVLFESIVHNSKTDINSYIKSKNKIGSVVENQVIKLVQNDDKFREYDDKIRLVEDTLRYFKNGKYESDVIKYKLIKYQYIDKPKHIVHIKNRDVIFNLQLEGHNIDKQYFNKLKGQVLKEMYLFARDLKIL